MNSPTNIAVVAGACVAVSLLFFFINFFRLGPEHQLAFRKDSKPGKLVNAAIVLPLVVGIVLGPISLKPYFAGALAAFSVLSIPIQHQSLIRLGLARSWVNLNSSISCLGSVGMLLFAIAFARGFYV